MGADPEASWAHPPDPFQRSDGTNVLGFWALLSLGGVILDCLSVLEVSESLTDDI